MLIILILYTQDAYKEVIASDSLTIPGVIVVLIECVRE